MGLQLYTFWRSSAAYRVRIALHYKGLDFESVPTHLLRDGAMRTTSPSIRRAWCQRWSTAER
jgi:glutathione S-transferase